MDRTSNFLFYTYINRRKKNRKLFAHSPTKIFKHFRSYMTCLSIFSLLTKSNLNYYKI